MPPRSFSASQFLFRIDDGPGGASSPGLLRSVTGGGISGKMIEEGLGSDHRHLKHVGVVELEKIDIELAISLAAPFLKWIQESWKRGFARRTGAIIHADFDYKERYVQEFGNALIAETTFPGLDGANPDAAFLSVSLEPEVTSIKKGDGSMIQGVEKPGQKRWLTNNFRFDLEGGSTGALNCSYINKIDSFKVSQTIKKVYHGESRFPELEPVSVNFGDLTVYMALEHAADFIKWHEAYVLKGGNDAEHEKTGVIEFLGPDCVEVLFSINLLGVGINSLTIESSKADGGEIKRAKVGLYVESMELAFEE